MTDSEDDSGPGIDPDTRREDRRDAIRRWVRYIQDNPPEVWGPQQNRVVEAQLAAARAADLDADHYERLRRRSDER